MLVHQILKSKASEGVVTVKSATKVSDVARILTEKGIGTVVISDDGKTPQGILSERDIVRQLSRVGSGCLDQSAGDYMTSKLVTCTLQSNVDDVLRQMTDGRFRHMPVLEADGMVGLVSLGDVVKAQLAQLEMEKDALEHMIMGH